MFSNELQSSSNERLHEFILSADQNCNSFLQSFPKVPLNKAIYGCYEINAQFQYSFSSNFDKNLTTVTFHYILVRLQLIHLTRFLLFCVQYAKKLLKMKKKDKIGARFVK